VILEEMGIGSNGSVWEKKNPTKLFLFQNFKLNQTE